MLLRVMAALASLVLALAALGAGFATSLATGSLGEVSIGISIGYALGFGLVTGLLTWAAIAAGCYAFRHQ